MASADFCTRIPTPCDVSSTKAHMQISPGIAHVPSRLCLSDIRRSVPCKYRASQIFACLPRCAASYPLPVRQASALPSASSGFAVARDTLAVRLALLLAECAEDFHLQVRAPCRAHKKKGAVRRPIATEEKLRVGQSPQNVRERRSEYTHPFTFTSDTPIRHAS